jgi:hypothetical protein
LDGGDSVPLAAEVGQTAVEAEFGFGISAHFGERAFPDGTGKFQDNRLAELSGNDAGWVFGEHPADEIALRETIEGIQRILRRAGLEAAHAAVHGSRNRPAEAV